MCQDFWRAKLWGLLHRFPLAALDDCSSQPTQIWRSLACMAGWTAPDSSSEPGEGLSHVGLCDVIASASDRAAISYLTVDSGLGYSADGLEIHHLLSGNLQKLKLDQWHDWLLEQNGDRSQLLQDLVLAAIPEAIQQELDPKKVFWWFWRCYLPALEALDPQTGKRHQQPQDHEDSLALLPSDPRFPDASCWSHATMTSALAGSLNGYQTEAPTSRNADEKLSRPHIAIFSFSPVQELIKASRKMRDFWAGSWVLHYLSAKVCWAIARKYGPDTLLYPCLYEQPIIDHWLRDAYQESSFQDYIPEPSPRSLLTAGFPNVLVMILPDNGEAGETPHRNLVQSALAFAEQTLRSEWKHLGQEVLDYLQKGNAQAWIRNLNPHTWHDWLKHQWQFYSVALPVGDRSNSALTAALDNLDDWAVQQNRFASPDESLFQGGSDNKELNFFRAAVQNQQIVGEVNIGSWWPKIFEQTRAGLGAVKTARTWKVPTAYSVRSSISGVGPAVATKADDGTDWVPEGKVAELWKENMGMFDGIETLNATEVLKRGLHKVLAKILFDIEPRDTEKLFKKTPYFYPDLTAGAAGWLRQMEQAGNQDAFDHYQQACEGIEAKFPWLTSEEEAPGNLPWGIPWIVEHHDDWINARVLNPGWASVDYVPPPEDSSKPRTQKQLKQQKQDILRQLRNKVEEWFSPGNNPTDWYVLAAGDGDGMGEWLNGSKLTDYSEYVAKQLKSASSVPELQPFLNVQKRMGPASHSALSRALLDFSNRLLPYLTEERYAGRLIYGGGDDVLAYTNLWEWDDWLWDVRQCFCGGSDSKGKFENHGDYWQWREDGEKPNSLPNRPLFTMGKKATISFGMVIAHHSVPLAIALENLWDAEEQAKKHYVQVQHTQTTIEEDQHSSQGKKDAVQVRVIYGNGNTLKATCKFEVFEAWRSLLLSKTKHRDVGFDPALFEQAAQIWQQHPVPVQEAIPAWTQVFCDRRDLFKNQEEAKAEFQRSLTTWLESIWNLTVSDDCDREVQNWLKLTAFVLRNRDIKPRKKVSDEV